IDADNDEIVIGVPAKLLQKNIEFIDTPGFDDETGGKLEQMSKRAINEADMAVFCCNVLQLGKISERALLDDLAIQLGHFCMVLSRVDNLNTEQDWKDIKKKAEWLMRDRGDNVGIEIQEKIFPVVAAGSSKNIEPFREYLTVIISDKQIQNKIKRETDRRRIKRFVDDFGEKVKQVQETLLEDQDHLEHLNNKIVREKELQALALKNKLINEAEKSRIVVKDYAGRCMNAYKAGLEFLNDPQTFSSQAKKLSDRVITALIENIAEYGGKVDCMSSDKIQAILRGAVGSHSFSVPEPKREPVKSRGVLGRTLYTAVNVFTLDFEVDDGYDYVYRDYKTPAVTAFLNGPITLVLSTWIQLTRNTVDGIETSGFLGGYEGKIKEIQQSINICDQVVDKLEGLCAESLNYYNENSFGGCFG
ncbi:MAG: hypothetical protein Q4D81_14205, partial [Eubacteriales bacterium]|nr:hypothetical protein [Eubacteriales bacterium]